MPDAAPANLTERLQTDLTAAMKARDAVAKITLRSAIAAVKEARVAGDQAHELSDDEVESVLRNQVKRRDEAAEAFRSAGRDEQAERELAEKAVLEAYLPKGLSQEEIIAVVDATLGEGGFSEPAQLGQAMKAVMAAIGGRADGRIVSEMVKGRLER